MILGTNLFVRKASHNTWAMAKYCRDHQALLMVGLGPKRSASILSH